MHDSAIVCENVWKIFGDRTDEALAAARNDGLSKDEIIERFECVVGVADVDFTVRHGEIFCVMGLSGSGKSTLIRHINRLIEPTAGRILVYGEDVNRKSYDELRQMRAEKIGMVFQHMALFPHRTVRDNVAFGLEIRNIDVKERRRVAEEKLALVQLAGWGDRLPAELSGGMQQRVGLARALASDPVILLMDEPFSALDPLIRRQLQGEFLDLTERVHKTTLFITHDLDEAIRLGDRIAIMKDGRFSQIGTPEEIITNPADEYVADFVQGISRLKLIYARTIMRPIDEHRANEPSAPLDGCPTVPTDATLNELIDCAIETEKPILVEDEPGHAVGVITKRTLLRSIQGEQ
jgi:glycine betaine/proline transport system ATP-binding protein